MGKSKVEIPIAALTKETKENSLFWIWSEFMIFVATVT